MPEQLAWDFQPGSVQASRPAQFRAGSRTLRASECFDVYWRFAAERQRIFHGRAAGEPPPWTNDPVLTRHKFTNVYRAADRVSQYLISDVIYTGSQDPIQGPMGSLANSHRLAERLLRGIQVHPRNAPSRPGSIRPHQDQAGVQADPCRHRLPVPAKWGLPPERTARLTVMAGHGPP